MSFRVTWLLAAAVAALAADGPGAAVRVNQVGYLPAAPKAAVVAYDGEAGGFTVLEAGSGRVVLRGSLSAPVQDADSGDTVRMADFSALKKPPVLRRCGRCRQEL
jgi:endoglucanase